MTRKKVKLAFITNDSARKATFKKRKKGMMKKVEELSTLCGIDACAVIYSPYEAETQPEVWPSPLATHRLISQFKTMPETEQSKKMVNQESFLRQRINKVKEQLNKLRKENREKEITHVMHQCLVGKANLDHLNMMDLNDLQWIIDQSMKDIHYRVEALKKGVFSRATGLPSGGGVPRTRGLVLNSQYEEQQPAAAAPPMLDSNVQRQLLVDLMNSSTQMGGPQIGNTSEMMSFGDDDNNNNTINNYNINNNVTGTWSNAFFPWEK